MDEDTSDKRLDSEPSEDKEVVVVGWDEDDPENPFNWPRRRKYINVLIPIYICLLTAANSTSTGIMAFWGPARFHTTRLGFQFSVTSYLIAFSFASLVTAPLSELLGRKRIYQAATMLSALLFIPQALTTNLALLLSMRAIQGVAASAGNALIGGSIADLFRARERSLSMNLFVLANLVGQGFAEFMFTEPIVAAICLWIGFNWSCIYLGMSSTLLVFGQYGWSPGWLGTIQLTTVIGGLVGFLSSYHQEILYTRACKSSSTGQARPEARLYYAMLGAAVFPAAMYGFAWTGRPHIPWPVPALFLTIAFAAISAMYAGVYNYLADAYETYSASAQAAHGFSRSIFAACFPLLTHAMYFNLGFPIASTLVASIALVLGLAPVLIYVYGPRLRARSKVTSALTRGAF
ncbi:hypothetical protein CcaverHIS002_0203930 [Cutaneotrichosporon cavernicola]|uniref:MFS general substrate transporter n=1 Tax=Cutaneotrichosporon cavernicola TaxID=279322 RepID=A0AA48IA59_9TREE|nr:uncharacterized protein CcaverHIS019_0203890 [Cutaneotrichosporon cavernicola]BEI81233.1 hypothetical protein CcaverHIS002_0203930 [Cutaneotrichosporon cavernicola]BEI89027.1 hypothetical protein CcaverHIS019_0203890 [Cutaneotrichosporon cavernicola]BEI96803.1 hypothetical protein CcaverHIS631_0203920 [Cutaneotrichosporon cavernicola]BEJ04575.1 hypothetical protein CcaverHIS641_0203920 [Cutaneotrichosporon cavernicola]